MEDLDSPKTNPPGITPAPRARSASISRHLPALRPGAEQWIEASEYPCFIVGDGGCLFDMNSHASAVVERGNPLWLSGGALRARHRESQHRLAQAIAQVSAHRTACLCVLVAADDQPAAALVPLDDGRRVLVKLERVALCDSNVISGYAASIRLTPSETRVLELLASGHAPKQIGLRCSTTESTVRTQIKSLLAKSRHHAIRDLLLRLARLPSLDPLRDKRAFDPGTQRGSACATERHRVTVASNVASGPHTRWRAGGSAR